MSNICAKRHVEGATAVVALPDSQAGTARHKCAHCAFEAGFAAGLAAAKEAVEGVARRREQL